MKLARRIGAVAVGAAGAVLLVGGLAVAQQPQPAPPPPGQQVFPGHPSMGGGQRPPRVIGPDGRPLNVGPSPRPGRPGRPNGFPGQGFPGQPTGPGGRPTPSRPRPQPHAEPEEAHGGGEHECPGHGPDDPPPPINLWHGMLVVNNELAQKPGVLNQLLFRYKNDKDPCDPRNEEPPYLASLLNFAVLVLVLFRFGRQPLTDALVKRKQAIMAEIDTATKIKEDAESRLEDYEEKLENLEQKLAEVRAEYAAQAEAEKKHIVAEAEERRARLRRDAELRVEQERKAMRDELLREAVLAATTAAEALIHEQMAAADQERMAADFLASVGPALGAGSTGTARGQGAQS
jgi:F-type H+-transporting ATPase subunit b